MSSTGVPGASDAGDAAESLDLAACEAATQYSPKGDLAWALPVAARAFGELARASVVDLPGGARGYLVLATVVRGVPRSQLALAQQLGVDKTLVTYLLDNLEAAGLIERRPDPADRRARQILITDRGREALAEFNARLGVAAAALLAPLSAAEATTFREMLERIAHNAQNGPGDCSGEDLAPATDRGED